MTKHMESPKGELVKVSKVQAMALASKGWKYITKSDYFRKGGT